MLFLEIQDGKEAMAGKKYCDKYRQSVALTLRLTEYLHGHGDVVHGESAFSSVATCTALLEHSTYFSGLLKTAHKEFPRKFCQEMVFSAQAKRGDTFMKKVHGVVKYIYDHVWNEPGSEGAPRKIIISPWNHGMSVDDHARKRWHLNESTGESEVITHTVPHTQMIKSYFEAACVIDVHNHLRQDGLGMENAIGTSKWWFWLMCIIIGMVEVDTFKTFYHFNRHKQVPSHRNFIERLVIMLLTNSKGGASLPHSSFNSGSTRGMTVMKMKRVMLNVRLSTRLCQLHSISMLEKVTQDQLKERTLEDLAKEYIDFLNTI